MLTSHDDELRRFIAETRFRDQGWIVTDLDGTAIHEFEGRIAIPDVVSHGLKALSERGRPVVLNTLRFPLNVIRTFGREWNAITNAPLPLISLNGSVTGYLAPGDDDVMSFREIDAAPLGPADIDEVLEGIEGLVASGINDLVLFHYPRDWTAGERIWTPLEENIARLSEKYRSASLVHAGATSALRDALVREEPCMMLLLVDAPEDRLMAYQHAKRSSFITAKGVDKLTGLTRLAQRLGLDPAEAVGAGDTPMDSFLSGVGLSIRVGPIELEFKGLTGAIAVPDSLALGELFFRLANLLDGRD